MLRIFYFLVLSLFVASAAFGNEVIRKTQETQYTQGPVNDFMKSYQLVHTFYLDDNQVARQVMDFAGKVVQEDGNVPDGVVKEYYDSGKLKREVAYQENRCRGLQKTYYENGVLASETTYRAGIPDGPSKGYYENGNLKAEGEWKDGKQVGTHKVYFENGQLQQELEIKDDGSVHMIQYDEEGRLLNDVTPG